MGFLKKVTKTIKKGWKDTFGWADDPWMKDYVLPVAATVASAYFGGPIIAGAMEAAGASASAAAAIGTSTAASAGASAYQGARASHLQDKAQKEQIAAMRDIANQQAAAAAVPVATSVAKQETVTGATQDANYATERRRAMSMADTRTSANLRRWSSSGKRRTL